MSNSENGNSKLQMVCVVAMANNRVIGDGDSLIWHLPGDLARVKSITMGCPLIMGRRTWYSIGRPLPGRLSIVLTSRWLHCSEQFITGNSGRKKMVSPNKN